VTLFDCLTNQPIEIDCDDLATEIASQEESKHEVVITRTPKEAIAVLLDVSASMGNTFFGDLDTTRIDAVKMYFSSFAERTMAYDLHHVVSLILFGARVEKVCSFTENFGTFVTKVRSARPSGTTKLYSALY
jgi:Mg-chelatase subunit ChlD